MSWPVVQISEIAEIVGGSTPSRNRPEYWDGDIAWATPKDLSNIEGPILEDTPQRISQAGFDSCSTYLLPKGSVLLSSRAPIGLVAIAGRAMCTNQGFKSFVLNGRLDPLYLYHFLKMSRSSLEAMGSGSTFKEISKAATARIQIPLPPLDIQKKIAAVLDKADSIRRKRKQVLSKLDELLQSVFLDMFGDPVTNPKGWEVKKLGDVVVNLDSRRVPIKQSDRDLRSGPYPYYGASGIIDHIDDFIYDGRNLLIGEDGANLLARSTPIAFIV
ncbi:MAG: restriction endonuclease subunit S, partial [Leptospiraceae bacterium]|nr:restriction endonuclease subunit S [Leptospiraceae bacterium]